MRIKSKYVNSAEINGRMVSFFTPPHDEPDFFWVDVEELARAFLPRAAARKMVKHSQDFDRTNRAAETAAHNGKIVTIISHPLAGGLCGAIDQLNGYQDSEEDEWGGGPAFLAYTKAAATIMQGHSSGGIPGLIAAFKNQGGPNLRGFKDGEGA
jgi:hypothetical protein